MKQIIPKVRKLFNDQAVVKFSFFLVVVYNVRRVGCFWYCIIFQTKGRFYLFLRRWTHAVHFFRVSFYMSIRHKELKAPNDVSCVLVSSSSSCLRIIILYTSRMCIRAHFLTVLLLDHKKIENDLFEISFLKVQRLWTLEL